MLYFVKNKKFEIVFVGGGGIEIMFYMFVNLKKGEFIWNNYVGVIYGFYFVYIICIYFFIKVCV